MRIAVIGAKGLPPEQGGIEHHCAEIYPRMVAQGHSVDLFARSLYTNQPAWSRNTYKGVRVLALPGSKRGGADVLISSALGSIFTAGKYDIIHFHALGPALFSWLPRIISPAKIVVTCHGLDWQRAKWSKTAKRSIRMGEQIAASCAHEVVVVSEALQSYFLETYDRKSTYIPNAPATYAPSDPNFTWVKSLGLKPSQYLVFLGRLVPEKRPDLLIQAFQHLQPEGWKLVLVGAEDSSDFRSYLHNLANGNKNIIFTGQLLRDRLAEIVRGSGLCVLPSDMEGLPMAMLEAMSEGIPVIASDIPPHEQLLAPDRGILFRRGEVKSCIEKLDWALSSEDALQQIASRAKKYVTSHYNWDVITTQFLDLYEATLTQSEVSSKKIVPVVTPEDESITLTDRVTCVRYTETDSPLDADLADSSSEISVPHNFP
jgi:glycosyltransferase involved in cell wall biosynthesis